VRQQSLLDLGHSPTPGCRNHSKTDFFNGIAPQPTFDRRNRKVRAGWFAAIPDLPGL
jgi:hypothetical protein